MSIYISIGIIIGLLISILVIVVTLHSKSKITRTLNQIESTVAQKGEIIEPDDDKITDLLEAFKEKDETI